MSVPRRVTLSVALLVVAATIIIVGLPDGTADAHFTSDTGGTNMEQPCVEPAFNLVSVAGVSLLDGSELIPPPHHRSYLPPPKCWKVKTSCKMLYHYTDVDSNGKVVSRTTCQAWNYRWKCSY